METIRIFEVVESLHALIESKQVGADIAIVSLVSAAGEIAELDRGAAGAKGRVPQGVQQRGRAGWKAAEAGAEGERRLVCKFPSHTECYIRRESFLLVFSMFSISRKTIATILAVVMYGVGHIYLGAGRRGIAILAIGIGLSLIAYPGYLGFDSVLGLKTSNISAAMIIIITLATASLVSLGFWVWQIFDARKIAKQQIEA